MIPQGSVSGALVNGTWFISSGKRAFYEPGEFNQAICRSTYNRVYVCATVFGHMFRVLELVGATCGRDLDGFMVAAG